MYRFVTTGTYESRLFDIAARKLGLEQAVLGKQFGGDGTDRKSRNKDEIEGLLKHGAYRFVDVLSNIALAFILLLDTYIYKCKCVPYQSDNLTGRDGLECI